ncbi:MAG: IS1634 family transposase [Thermoanaerobaculia bacterium]
MARRSQRVHVVTTVRRYKGRIYRTHLLRHSYRENGQVKNETVGNLSHLPEPVVELIRKALQGEILAPVTSVFEIVSSSPHGHVQAVLAAMRRLGFASLVASRPCRERDLVVAMVAARVLEPHSKLATTRAWRTTTLAEECGVQEASEDDLYAAMDWLLERQSRIERKLAARHLDEQSLALYDLTSSYFEGVTCPLAKLGHNRDGKEGKLQVNYGLLTDSRGCPVSVSVYPGNTGDATTVLAQVHKVREEFGIHSIVLVGDRGMISQKQIDQIRQFGDIDWITALKTGEIRKLLEKEALQMGLFDERNLFELRDPAFPGERLVACRNPLLAKLRAHTRQSLIEATTREFEKVQGMVTRGKLKSADEIGLRVGQVANKYSVAKHFKIEIRDGSFAFHLLSEKVEAEAALDGIYVIRTSLGPERLNTDDTVRSYKLLSNVERAFRSLKTVDLHVRPIFHHLEARVRAHIFLCTLAYYVQWHMLEAWRELLFSDEDQQAKLTRDPVAPAKRSPSALLKASTHTLDDGTEAHSFRTLLKELSTIVSNVCRRKQSPDNEATFTMVTTANAKQQRALDLLEAIVA